MAYGFNDDKSKSQINVQRILLTSEEVLTPGSGTTVSKVFDIGVEPIAASANTSDYGLLVTGISIDFVKATGKWRIDVYLWNASSNNIQAGAFLYATCLT